MKLVPNICFFLLVNDRDGENFRYSSDLIKDRESKFITQSRVITIVLCSPLGNKLRGLEL